MKNYLIKVISSNYGYIGAMGVATLLVGCANPTRLEASGWREAYRNCPESSQAYFGGIPIASLSNHKQAEHFSPTIAANCAIYVFANWSSGSKSAHASVFLYHEGTEPPPIPPDYWPLFGMNTLAHPRWSDRFLLEKSKEYPEFRKAEIYAREVYAMWELLPGAYVLDASVAPFAEFARVAVNCRAGRTVYFGLAKQNFLSVNTILSPLDEIQARDLARFRLLSAGKQPGGPLTPGWIGNRSCKMESK